METNNMLLIMDYVTSVSLEKNECSFDNLKKYIVTTNSLLKTVQMIK